MLTTCPSSSLDVAARWRELGTLEDQAAAARWTWDAGLSHRVDHLLVLIEDGRR